MSLVETLAQHLTVGRVFLLLFVAWIGRIAAYRIYEYYRVTSLGAYGPRVPTYLPFDLDFIYKSVKATMARNEINHWNDVMLGREGHLTRECRPFNERFIITVDPENVKAILASQFSDFGKGEPFHKEWSSFLGDSIFTTDGPQWHASRQLIRPQFTKDRVSDLECFEAHMQTLFQAIEKGGPLLADTSSVSVDAAQNKIFNISDLFFRYTLDVTTDFLLGADVKSLSYPKQDFANAFDEVQRLQNILSRLSKLAKFIPKPSFWSSIKLMDDFVNQYIERALCLTQEELEDKTKSDKGYTFLHALAAFTRDRKVLRDQIVAVLLAGRDTTAGTLSWAMYELARTPHAVTKLRAEILAVVGKDRCPTYEHLKNMPYLRAVINETLRLYPAVPYNVRLALKDATLPRGGGPDGSQPIGVLKHSRVVYSTMMMQRRPELYPPISDKFADPAIFSPERWEHWHPKPHNYIPFNSGPRICVGQQFALTEMGYVLCRLFQKYDGINNYMGPLDSGVPNLKTDITVSPGQGVWISLQKAKD
jgi:cytochrome P450